MGAKLYDFGGWATKNDLKCSDGRTIRRDAFKDNDGTTVPLVWNHDHHDPMNVLGHALLENRDEGVYAYCTLNDTAAGQNAKSLVQHGDVTALSIYANRLKQQGGDVLHGAIREVSLVLAGANPGAMIDSILEHGEYSEEEAVIYTNEEISVMPFDKNLSHADEEVKEEKAAKPEEADGSEETVEDVFNTLTEKQKTVVYALIGQAIEDAKGGSVKHADVDEDEDDDEVDEGETVEDVFNTLTKKQKTVVYALIGQAIEGAKGEKNNDKGEESEGEKTMSHNVFENDREENVLSHSDMEAIIADGKRCGSLKEAFLAHGIDQIEYLFPEATATSKAPQWVNGDQTWVTKLMNAVSHSPFARVKSVYADITEDDARALGFLADHTHRDSKGNLVDGEGNPAFKKEEVFTLLKRVTTPTTVYKKQKLDRDDVIDITDFDVVAWIKTEMRAKLDEEIARAVLIGDGRLTSSDDKINESSIRPILTDSDFFTIKAKITTPTAVSDADKAKAIIRAAVKARAKYRGSGSPLFFTTEDTLSELLLLEDAMGRRLYETEAALAAAMRVSGIYTVSVMENYKNAAGQSVDVIGVIVNPADYTIGADKGGAVNMFDDFDIDYNAQKYLIETRCSGALTKPYSAIALTAEKSGDVSDVEITITTSKTI